MGLDKGKSFQGARDFLMLSNKHKSKVEWARKKGSYKKQEE